MKLVSHKPFAIWSEKQNTQHRGQPVSGTKVDTLSIVSKVYSKPKPTLRQRLWGWPR